jgi:hypothetical protein
MGGRDATHLCLSPNRKGPVESAAGIGLAVPNQVQSNNSNLSLTLMTPENMAMFERRAQVNIFSDRDVTIKNFFQQTRQFYIS